jgi:hypothetical protein
VCKAEGTEPGYNSPRGIPSHATHAYSQAALESTGGAGLFDCFAID